MKCNKAIIAPAIWRPWFVLASFAIAQNCIAQQVFKCVEKGKPDSYQSHPCANAPAVKAWDAVPDRENPYLRARLAQMQREVDARRVADAARGPYMAGIRGGGFGAAIPAAPSRSVSRNSSSYACESARRQRDAVYSGAGHRRSFAVSRAMDNAVYDACK
ncbi:DUF4124 domain-containing protein [Stenotrophomonas acidaminiphila]|uniref:DUF4124 domain-containing protein n=1 Tax=Stenotrophomonas acidaminiphila TaxID=128780 RepID=UPI0028995F4A|nr:DUF4124 domain-containing protein [Stenotrophomonas acidaminiphila]